VISSGKIRTLCNNSNRNLIIVIGVLAAFTIAMSVCAHWLSRFPGDLNITLLFQSLHSNTLLLVMKWVSYMTESWRSTLLVIVGGILIWWRLGKLQAALTVAAGLISLLDSVLKLIVGRLRPRPDLVQVWVVERGNGFPSGHAFYAMLFLGLMAYFAFTYLRRPGLRMFIVVSLLMLILLIGASRVYLGAHWPSDVLGGYLIGAVFWGIFIWSDRVLKRPFQATNARRVKKFPLSIV
jgi:membrane-associated phospholipid phosphatase